VLQRRASPLIRPWFGLTRAEEGKTRVQFVWEPAARVPGERSRTGVPARAILDVLDAEGAVLFAATVDAGGGSQAVFDVEPGRVQLRIQIEDEGSTLLDTDVRDLVVDPLNGPIAFGTPQVLRARSAREFRALDGDPDAVRRDAAVRRTDRLLIRTRLRIEGAALVAKPRRSMGQCAGFPSSRLQARRSSIDLPLSGLASGDYPSTTVATGRIRGQDRKRSSFASRWQPPVITFVGPIGSQLCRVRPFLDRCRCSGNPTVTRTHWSRIMA
jgi:hypothetical protein